MEQQTEIYPELVLGDPENPDNATIIIGRNGDSSQLVLTVGTPNGAAVIAHFVPDATLEVVMSAFILLRSSEVVGVSPATTNLFARLMEGVADDE